MHRDEVRIFHGDVETYLRRMERFGRSAAAAPLVGTTTTRTVSRVQLEYGRLPTSEDFRWWRAIVRFLELFSHAHYALLIVLTGVLLLGVGWRFGHWTVAALAAMPAAAAAQVLRRRFSSARMGR
jgi:hypothetical protein